MWCIPPGQNAAFVAAMEDVLELYSRPYDPEFPLVCMDEQPIELHEDAYPAMEMCVFAIGNQQKYQKNSALFPKPQFTFFSTI